MTDETTAHHPLGLPRGSVRAVLALAVFGTAMALLGQEKQIGQDLWLVTTVVLGYYFASRQQRGETPPADAAPLYLPRGSVRWLIFLSFAGTAGYLIWHWQEQGKNILEQDSLFPIIAIGSFFADRLLHLIVGRSDGQSRLVRLFNNGKAIIALAAAAVVVMLYLAELKFDGDERLARMTISFVFFYFGSR